MIFSFSTETLHFQSNELKARMYLKAVYYSLSTLLSIGTGSIQPNTTSNHSSKNRPSYPLNGTICDRVCVVWTDLPEITHYQ